MKNRKELPGFGIINKTIDITRLQQYCIDNQYTDYTDYTDIKFSSESKHQSFLVANTFNKESFFKESTADFLEGDKYKQLYLTDIDPSKMKTDSHTLFASSTSIFSRTKRLNPLSDTYIPEADELNYNIRNKHVTDIFSEILDTFNSTVTRVRLAVLMPKFNIKPHVDYDPSYITRYHIPIFTNEQNIFGIKIKNENIEFNMKADGSVYFLNTGLLHWVNNNSDFPRLHLIIDTHGQDDLIFV